MNSAQLKASAHGEPKPDNLEGGDGVELEGASRRRGHIYTYDWFLLMDGRNWHGNVKQLSSN